MVWPFRRQQTASVAAVPTVGRDIEQDVVANLSERTVDFHWRVGGYEVFAMRMNARDARVFAAQVNRAADVIAPAVGDVVIEIEDAE